MRPIQKSSSTTGILNKSTESGKFTCDDLCGESESYWASVIWGYLARIKCANIVPGWLWMGLSEPRTWLIVSGFPEVVDRQTSDTSWCSCYKNIVYKHIKTLKKGKFWVCFSRASRYEPHSLRDWKVIISVHLYVVHFVTDLHFCQKRLFLCFQRLICPF